MMTPEIVNTLESSRDAFTDALAGVSEAQATVSPGPDRWSILQVVEHVATSEAGMFSAFAMAQPSEVSLENREKELNIAARVTNRLARIEAPERARPTGRYTTLAAALEAFQTARERTIAFARERQSSLHFCTVRHPLLGEVNGYELLLIMASHARRHAAQIHEIGTG